MKKQDPTLYTGDILQIQKYKYTESERTEKTDYANSNHKKVAMALLISNKLLFKAKKCF